MTGRDNPRGDRAHVPGARSGRLKENEQRTCDVVCGREFERYGGSQMTTRGSDYYVLPSTWCDICKRQVSCDALVWDVAGEQLATFVCPNCEQTLGVGLHGEIAWTSRRATGRERGDAHR